MRADTEKKLLYVGEAADLVKRLIQPHDSIAHWDRFRYDVLPTALAPVRRELERMVIRDCAELFGTTEQKESLPLSEYVLVNRRVDT